MPTPPATAPGTSRISPRCWTAARPSRRARPGRGIMDFGAEPHGFEPREVAAFGAETPNGNSVSLEDQMMRAAEVRQEHDLALGVYTKTLEILRTAVAKR